jgi:hypothetical protein
MLDLREPSGQYPAISERLVARLWEDQGPFHRPLLCDDGSEVQVVYRGRRRWDRGPDFPDALIATGNAGLCHGDVEIHVRSGDWRLHGHSRDAHYNRVVLHVVMWDDAPGQTARQDGVRVPVLALSSCLAAPLESLLALTGEESPRPSPCWPGSPDFDGPLGGLLEWCGMDRFAGKAARFEADLSCLSGEQLLYQGIAEALGYTRNREPFRRLAEILPLETLLAYRRTLTPNPQSLTPAVEALLLGAAGLLPPQPEFPSLEVEPYARLLRERWAADKTTWAGGAMVASEWQFFRVRPANFPPRRVAALAAIVDRWPEEGLAAWMECVTRSCAPKLLPRRLESFLLGLAPGGYWSRHSDFGLPLPRPLDLVGRHRAAEVAVNVLLPFAGALAASREDGELAMRVREAYRLYPKRGDNEVSRYMGLQITARPRPPVARSACRQQGLLHLYRTRCERKRCWECLVQALPA